MIPVTNPADTITVLAVFGFGSGSGSGAFSAAGPSIDRISSSRLDLLRLLMFGLPSGAMDETAPGCPPRRMGRTAKVHSSLLSFDLFPIDGADVIQGDIHDPSLWDDIRRRGFDFCICSHLLEDIRDPIFVMRQIARTFRHGYIAMPNKHVEFSHVESKRYVGYCHHRWIFTLADGELRLVAKFPFASHFSPRYHGLTKIKASLPAKALRRLIHKTPRLSDIGPLPWWDAKLADRRNELAFIWTGDLRFRMLNDDFAGRTTYETAILYYNELREGL